MINKLDYDHIEMLVWTFQLDLFINIEYSLLNSDGKFSIIKLNKLNSIKMLDPIIYDEIRLFDIKMYSDNIKLFFMSSDNYGEYTKISMDKSIDEEKLLKMLEAMFKNE